MELQEQVIWRNSKNGTNSKEYGEKDFFCWWSPWFPRGGWKRVPPGMAWWNPGIMLVNLHGCVALNDMDMHLRENESCVNAAAKMKWAQRHAACALVVLPSLLESDPDTRREFRVKIVFRSSAAAYECQRVALILKDHKKTTACWFYASICSPCAEWKWDWQESLLGGYALDRSPASHMAARWSQSLTVIATFRRLHLTYRHVFWKPPRATSALRGQSHD